MAIRCPCWGFLLALYAATEFIQAARMPRFRRPPAREAAIATMSADTAVARWIAAARAARSQNALAADGRDAASLAPIAEQGIGGACWRWRANAIAARRAQACRCEPAGQAWDRTLAAAIEKRAELGKAIAVALQPSTSAQADCCQSRQNKLLITLLALFVVAQILFRNIGCWSNPSCAWRPAAERRAVVARPCRLAPRRDESAFSPGADGHFRLVVQRRETARDQKGQVTDRLSRQEDFKRASLSFQDASPRSRRGLRATPDACRRRRRTSSRFLGSRRARRRFRASTQRVSDNVDVVASSIRDMRAR